MARTKKSCEKESQKPDYALLLDNLYIALYRKNDNPYTLRGNVFGYQTKLVGNPLRNLLNTARVYEIPFMPYENYQNILNGHAVSASNDFFSGSQERFFISHLGGWRSVKNTLSDLKNPLFHDNARGAGTVRTEFARDLSTWMCRPEEDGYTFFRKNDPMIEVDFEKTVYMSEYIVACNYQLVSGHCLDKDGLRLILGDFTEYMLDAEETRNKQGEKSLVKKNREALDCLIENLTTLLNAYDNSEDHIKKDWLLSRALTWLIIGALLRETISLQLVKYYIVQYRPNTDETGVAEPRYSNLPIPNMFWEAGKYWYEEVRKPGARFHSLDIVNHILPSAEDKPAESEYSFPFRASDTNENNIQCSRFSELLLDKNSVYHQGNFMLIGEGGIGKTTTLMSAMQDVYEGKEKYKGESVIPLFIELSLSPDSQDSHAYDGTSSTVIYRLIYAILQQKDSRKDRSDLLRECMNDKSNIAKDYVRELLDSTINEEIRYVLLIDGLNEVSAEPFSGRSSSAQGRILQEVKEIVDRYPNITVILTGRQSVFIDHPSFHSFFLRGLVWEEISDYLREKGKSERDIELIRNGDRGLLDALSIPMFLTMYVLLLDTEGVTTRGELMKVFFHERFERRKKEYAIHRQGDIAERIDLDEEQSISGIMMRKNISLSMQWLFLDILLPEIAAEMEAARTFHISEDKACLLLESLFTSQDSLYCGQFKKYANHCFKRRLNGTSIKRIISDFTKTYDQDEDSYTAAFLQYCESSLGILYREGEGTFGFIHQHFRDYFAAVFHINRMKIAYKAFGENDVASARSIMRHYDKEPLNPIIMVYIGEYLGEHHNVPCYTEETEIFSRISSTVRDWGENQLISNLLDIYREIDQQYEYSVYNLVEILKRVRKNLSGLDFQNLDLRKCHFNNVPLDSVPNTIFTGAVIDSGNWFAEGHSGSVNSASFNGDGSLVVTSSDDGTARIWDSRTGTLLHTLRGHSKGVSRAGFSQDGSLVVTASRDGTARIWDSQTGALLHTLKGHSDRVRSALFNQDGNFVVTASRDGTARIWDSRTGGLIHILKGHSGGLESACFSPDGSLIVTVSEDKTARIWDSRKGEQLNTLDGHLDEVISATFSVDGRLIITASLEDKTAQIWDSRTGALLHNLEGHTDAVRSALFSRDGCFVITASRDGTARIWDSRTGNLLHTLEGHSDLVRSASFSEDGSLVVTASRDGTARIWDSRTGNLLHILKENSFVVDASFSRNGRLVVTVSLDDNTARIWDTQTGVLMHILAGAFAHVTSAVFNRDGSLVVTASLDGTARIWDSRTGGLLHILKGHSGWVESACFSPDGSLVVTASDDKTARIWDSKTGALLHVLEKHMGRVIFASFNIDGNYVITTSLDKTARIWDSQTGELLNTLRGHSGGVESASFNVDGNLVVTASRDGTARIWDSRTGGLLHILEGHLSFVVSAIFSEDGSFVVTASMEDKTARIWDSQTGELLNTLRGHSREVESANFNVDGSLVVTASRDCTARIWDSRTGGLLHILKGHSGWVNSACFSPDGNFVVTASLDGTARIWDSQTGNLIHTIEGHSDIVNGANFSYDGRFLVTFSQDNTARIWDMITMDEIETLYEIPELYIRGVNFKDISPRSKMTEKQKEIFRQYGSII